MIFFENPYHRKIPSHQLGNLASSSSAEFFSHTAKVSGLSKGRLTVKETCLCMFRKKIRMPKRRSFYTLTDTHKVIVCLGKK
jgi:hypothetical protein